MRYVLLILIFASCRERNCNESLYMERWQDADQKFNNFRRDTSAMKRAIEEMREDTMFVLVGNIRFSVKKIPSEIQWRNDSIIITPAVAP